MHKLHKHFNAKIFASVASDDTCDNIVVIFQASLLQGDETESLHTRNAHRINCTARAIAVKVSYQVNSTDSPMKPNVNTTCTVAI